jgi:putative N6-adenine-specific DNA methylase
MPEYDAQKWENFKQVYDQKRIPLEKGKIFGADKDLTELSLCRAHLAKLGFIEQIELTHKEVFSYNPPHMPTLIVTDPPFGKRLQSSKKIYEDFGLFARRHCSAETKIFVLAPSEETVEPAEMSILSRFPLCHGGMDMFLFELKI